MNALWGMHKYKFKKKNYEKIIDEQGKLCGLVEGGHGSNKDKMGILRKGIFGGFENRTGFLIGRRVRGKSVVTALRHEVLKPRTQAQIDQQLKFELVVSFLKWFKSLIAIGFKDPKGKKIASILQ